MKVKFDNIQGLRGIAAVLVVLCHILTVGKTYSENGILPNWFGMGGIGIDLFFVISGYIMGTITIGKFEQDGYIYDFLKKRVLRIYPLYWVITSVTLALYIISQSPGSKTLGIQNIFFSYLLLPQSDPHIYRGAWTLTHEMYFYSMFAVFLSFSEKKLTRCLFYWSLAVIIVNSITKAPLPIVEIISSPYTMEFIWGVLVAKLTYSKKGFFIVISGSTLLFITSAIIYSGTIPFGPYWVRPFAYGIPFAIITYGFVSIERMNNIVCPKIFTVTGDASYSIYLTHGISLFVFAKLWFLTRGNAFNETFIGVFFVFFATLATGFLCYYILEKKIFETIDFFKKTFIPVTQNL